MAATVTFDGTRVNDSTVNTNWGNWGSGGATPASEAQLAYQGGSAVNTQVKTTALDGIDYDPGAGALDMTSAAYPLWFAKVIVSDSFDVNATEGVRLGIGSAAAANQLYNVAGSGANRPPFSDGYPAQGGYLFVALNPNISAWIEVDNTATLTAIDWFGAQCAMVTGGAKSENLALDAIDVGRGLYIVGTAISLGDTVTTDQDVTTNRWGVVRGATDQFTCIGLITIGRDSGGTAQVTGTDTSIITFPDGYHGPGDVGLLLDLATASSDFTLSGLYIGVGTAATSDTRPDFVVSGTTGDGAIDGGQFRNFRDIELTAGITEVVGADLEAQLITQAAVHIHDTIIRTNAITSVACIQDPTFGTTTDMHDVSFIQTGVGHALEIDTPGSYTLTNIGFSGYGADGTDSAAIDVTTTGAVTLNIVGGDTPTFKTAGTGNVTIVANPVTLTIRAIDQRTGTDIVGGRVLVWADAGGPYPSEESCTITRSGAVATVSHTAHGMDTGDIAWIEGADQSEYNGRKTITVTDANTYTFAVTGTPTTPATGTIISTMVFIDGVTNSSGLISDTRTYSANQPILGRVRKSS